MLDKTTAKIALRYVQKYKQDAADYLAEVDAWYRCGDGRSSRNGGKGHTFPYCFHGSSRWTDYDNICPGCEDGHSPYRCGWMYEAALDRAKADLRIEQERVDWINSAPKDLPMNILFTLIKWGLETIKP